LNHEVDQLFTAFFMQERLPNESHSADGVSGFQTLKTNTRRLVYLGVSKEWAEKINKRLDNEKQYLKTDYKVHCKEEVSPCADHCRHFE
jgi:hypothetical protein